MSPGMQPKRPPAGGAAPHSSAFSLIELLAVLAIGSLLLTLCAPAISGLAGGRTMSQMSSNMADVLNNARVQAMSRNTYVWVGFSGTAGGTAEGVTVAAVQSKTGAITDLGIPANLTTVMPPRVFPAIAMVDDGALVQGMEPGAADISTSDLGTFQTGSGNSSRSFSYVLQFSPQGETSVRANSPLTWINIGLKPLHGRPADLAAIQVSGLTGKVILHRP